jgi:hypothetical protein
LSNLSKQVKTGLFVGFNNFNLDTNLHYKNIILHKSNLNFISSNIKKFNNLNRIFVTNNNKYSLLDIEDIYKYNYIIPRHIHFYFAEEMYYKIMTQRHNYNSSYLHDADIKKYNINLSDDLKINKVFLDDELFITELHADIKNYETDYDFCYNNNSEFLFQRREIPFCIYY